jgi:tRNA G10  N-methylase Trm11
MELVVIHRKCDISNSLAVEECKCLTNKIPINGIAIISKFNNIHKSAYFMKVCQLFISSFSYKDFCKKISIFSSFINLDEFSIDFINRSNKKISSTKIKKYIANKVSWQLSLNKSKHKLVVIRTLNNRWIFARTINIKNLPFKQNIPRQTSSSIFQPIARAMVNIAIKDDVKSILDPLCGVGTIPIEAHYLGYNVIGRDKSYKMIKIAKMNLKLLSIKMKIEQKDVFNQNDYYDLVITDIPYDKNCHSKSQYFVQLFLKYIINFTEILIISSHIKLTNYFTHENIRKIDIFTVKKNNSKFTRYIHRIYVN